MDLNISSSNTAKSSLVSSVKASSHSLFEALVLIVVIVLFYIFIIGPKKAEVALSADNLSKLSAQQESSAQKLQTMAHLIAVIKSRPDDIRHLDESLPLSDSTIGLQILVNSLANDAGVISADISFNARNDRAAAGDKTLLAHPFGINRSLQTISGSIYVLGTFSQLESFIVKLENSARLIDITDMDMSAGKNGALDLKLSVQAYYYE